MLDAEDKGNKADIKEEDGGQVDKSAPLPTDLFVPPPLEKAEDPVQSEEERLRLQ